MLSLAVAMLLLRPLWRDARGVAIGIAVVMLASTALLYRIVGTPAALDDRNVHAPRTLDDAIAQLQAALRRDPRQPEGWRLLGQALQRENKATEARDAFARAAALAPEDAGLQVEAAQARALADPRRLFDDQAVALLRSALQREPGHQRARWFLGVAQRQAGKDAEAAATWTPLLAQVDAATATSLRKEIDSARAAAGLSPLADAPAAPAARAIEVKLALDPAFAARVRLRGDATVFVIARRPDGPPMPVAVEKHALSELPLAITLDDGDSPMPTLKLSQLDAVELVARVSASGQAGKQEGDLESRPVRVTLPRATPVELVIGD
ncbi:MAG: cytochrome C biogenesis protein [Lysobacteraceae bacterium]|nr:MAG: cytochrome C biogenesis protein [Xanthomonadaceae bacterium]